MEAGHGDAAEQIGGRHARRTAGSAALADRLPLPVRGLWERCAADLARCRVEMGRSHVVVVAVVLVLGLVAAAVVYGVSRPRVVPVAAELDVTGTPVAPDGDHPGTSGEGSHQPGDNPVAFDEERPDGVTGPGDGPGVVVVHVAGKVAQPGVVSLPVGSRVADAVDAAGGADSGVDMTPLNLARVLTDGEQVLVGVDPPPGVHPHPPHSGNPSPPGGDLAGGPVNLNSATAGHLETLPGIGPALAQRIIDWREEHGGFSSIDELHEISGIGPSKFEDIAPLVVL